MCSFEYLHHVRNVTFTNSYALINAASFNALAAFFDALEVDIECLAAELKCSQRLSQQLLTFALDFDIIQRLIIPHRANEVSNAPRSFDHNHWKISLKRLQDRVQRDGSTANCNGLIVTLKYNC